MTKFFIIILILFFCSDILSGQGTLRGKVTDENGEPLIGATIVIKAKALTGTVTDLNGNYSLRITEPAQQHIEVSYIGYTTLHDSVNPKNEEVIIKNYDMTMASSELGEVKIVARVSKAKESYMEKVKIKSGSFMDYISTETIKRTGDGNVSSAVSRITGVSAHNGFVTVRGISDRYIKTSINGLRIPTLDPFTNNFKLDLFPSSMVDNIVITKTASADMPGDWAGAYLSIETKDYPEKFTIGFETTAGYNQQSTFRNVISSQRSGTDWLGFDNGFRNIKHIPTSYNEFFNLDYKEFCALGLEEYFNGMGINENTAFIDSYKRLALVELGFLGKAQINDNAAYAEAVNRYEASNMKQEALLLATALGVKMGQSLPDTWVTIERKAPVDFSQSFSIGNQTDISGKTLGYLFGFKIYGVSQYDDHSTYGRADYNSNENIDLSNPYMLYNAYGIGESSIETNGWSAIFNTALKLNTNNSITFLFMPSFIGVNKARADFNSKETSGSAVSWESMSQYYESRQELVFQLKSEQFLPAVKTRVEMNASYTIGNSNTPDYRQVNYVLDPNTEDIIKLFQKKYSNNRVFRDLSEDLFDSYINAEIPLGDNPGIPRKIKFGGAFQRLIREADQRSYILPPYITEQKIFNNDLTGFFRLDSFALHNGIIKRSYWQEAGPANNTIGFSHTLAGYVMADYSVNQALRISGGLRIEYSHLHTDRLDFYERRLPSNDDRRIDEKDYLFRKYRPGIMDDLFFLPSTSILYNINHNQQAPVNLRLNYSRTSCLPSLRELTPYKVFDYSLMGIVTGNDFLKPVKIDNFDFRAEAFFKSGNNISLSLYYKNFNNHIEMIRQELDETYYSWQNADKSHVAGLELEGRLGITKNLDFRANATLVESKTNLLNDSISRSMFGQAPYIINSMLTYTLKEIGLEATVSYNLQGPKLVIAGTNGRADIYELPRNLIDSKITKKLGNHFTASFRIRDLLNTSIERAYKLKNGWLDFDRYTYGTLFILGIDASFN
jgi:outer membrane receptor protein involved in Fe transport